MIKKARLRKRFRRHWAALLENLGQYFDTGEAEAVHRSRVRVKRMRALLTVARADQPAGRFRAFETVRKVYREIGLLRSAFVALDLLKRHQLNSPALAESQEQILERQTVRFHRSFAGHLAALDKARPALSDVFRPLKNKFVRRYYKKQLKKLDRFFSATGQTTDDMHRYRKKLKTLLYFHKALPAALVKKLRLNTVYLRRLEEAIGQWHDVLMLLNLVKTNSLANDPGLAPLERKSRRLWAAILRLGAGFAEKALLPATPKQ